MRTTFSRIPPTSAAMNSYLSNEAIMETLIEIDQFYDYYSSQKNSSEFRQKIGDLIYTWDENEGEKIMPMNICKFISRVQHKKDVMDYFYYIMLAENICNSHDK